MKLFLCSHFSSVGSLIKEEIENKKVAFIPTASLREGYTGYVLPHYLTAPFKKVTEKIITEFSDLNLCPINNRQGIVIDGEGSKVICKE